MSQTWGEHACQGKSRPCTKGEGQVLRQERARRRASPKAQAERPKAEARGRERAEDQRGPDTKQEAAGNSMRAAIPLRQACLNNTRHIRKASASYATQGTPPKAPRRVLPGTAD